MGSLKSGCFLREGKPNEAASVVCAVALPIRSPAITYTFDMNASKYGLTLPVGQHIQLTDLLSGAVLGSFNSSITHTASVSSFGLQLLKLSVSGLALHEQLLI